MLIERVEPSRYCPGNSLDAVYIILIGEYVPHLYPADSIWLRLKSQAQLYIASFTLLRVYCCCISALCEISSTAVDSSLYAHDQQYANKCWQYKRKAYNDVWRFRDFISMSGSQIISLSLLNFQQLRGPYLRGSSREARDDIYPHWILRAPPYMKDYNRSK